MSRGIIIVVQCLEKKNGLYFPLHWHPIPVYIKQSETFYHLSKPKFLILCFH